MSKKLTHIANYILKSANRDNQTLLTPARLGELIYLSYGIYLSHGPGQLLFNGEIEAWENGPTVPSLHEKFKSFEDGPITQFEEDFSTLSQDEKDLLDSVWDSFKGFSEEALTSMCKDPNGPWSMSYQVGKKNVIDKKMIKLHFKELGKSD